MHYGARAHSPSLSSRLILGPALGSERIRLTSIVGAIGTPARTSGTTVCLIEADDLDHEVFAGASLAEGSAASLGEVAAGAAAEVTPVLALAESGLSAAAVGRASSEAGSAAGSAAETEVSSAAARAAGLAVGMAADCAVEMAVETAVG
ncbi:hypothetical protein T492DRAFT_904459 [Pavlovales sp. CCMP2436]|nr:hypothetical protein T492DRAFT_904459 [Pavlovales sp. CCMP2436]